MNLGASMSMIESRDFNLTYPLTFDPFTFEQYTLPANLGGVMMDDIGVVDRVEALALSFFLDVSDDWLVKLGDQWERKFLATVDLVQKHSEEIEIFKFVIRGHIQQLQNWFTLLL